MVLISRIMETCRSPLVAQQVENSVLLLLWHEFDPWPRNLRMSQVWPGKKFCKPAKGIC